jgi:hypothetical protein
VPCAFLLVLTALCLVVREEYPFSHFPMYSSFGKTTYYVHLADGTGKPLATLPTAGMMTATLKKMYDSELRKEVARLQSSRLKLTLEQKRGVGERVLAALNSSLWVQQQRPEFARPLRIYEVNVAYTGGRFEKRSDLIAEAP